MLRGASSAGRALVVLAACGGGPAAPGDAGVNDDDVWPNAVSAANSDPWIARHHDRIREMRPRVLALNFVNGRTNAEMEALLGEIAEGLKEGSRYHGYAEAAARPFLVYGIARSVDLTDATPPAGWPYRNSTRYPRKPPATTDVWGFDYAALFSATFTQHYGVRDPGNPARLLSLCEMFDRGLVHEVWIYGDADVPDVNAAEVLEHKQVYDAAGEPVVGQLDRCAGNGCFDEADIPPCGRTVRIGWINQSRGPGCFLHSLGHGFENMSSGSAMPLPYLREAFAHFANFDLDTRGLPFASYYEACSAPGCVSYPGDDAAVVNGTHRLDPLDQGCGNVHFPPNAREHFDYTSTQPVKSTCERFGLREEGGQDRKDTYTAAKVTTYERRWSDCGGGWQVYWRQSFPGRGNAATGPGERPMKNWWPYLFY